MLGGLGIQLRCFFTLLVFTRPFENLLRKHYGFSKNPVWFVMCTGQTLVAMMNVW